jgi:hypothetical protein
MEPVRMRYKSTPHAVIPLNYDSANPRVLPYINGTDLNVAASPEELGSAPSWDNNDNSLSEALIKEATLGTFDLDATDEPDFAILQGKSSKNGGNKISDKSELADLKFKDFYFLYYRTSAKYMTEVTSRYTSYYFKIKGTEIYYKANYSAEVGYYMEETNMDEFTTAEQVRKKNNVNTYSVTQGTIVDKGLSAFLFLGEIYRYSEVENKFGGDVKNSTWIPAGEPVTINASGTTIDYIWGDTWYQRYDCLKTYPFSQEDIN